MIDDEFNKGKRFKDLRFCFVEIFFFFLIFLENKFIVVFVGVYIFLIIFLKFKLYDEE